MVREPLQSARCAICDVLSGSRTVANSCIPNIAHARMRCDQLSRSGEHSHILCTLKRTSTHTFCRRRHYTKLRAVHTTLALSYCRCFTWQAVSQLQRKLAQLAERDGVCQRHEHGAADSVSESGGQQVVQKHCAPADAAAREDAGWNEEHLHSNREVECNCASAPFWPLRGCCKAR
jgi:hypothetical protein